MKGPCDEARSHAATGWLPEEFAACCGIDFYNASPIGDLAENTAMPYYAQVKTVAETAVFQRYSSEVWSNPERVEFINWIAANPEAGDVIRGSGGCRKVRWTSAGQGKRGGARVVYFNASTETIWLLIVYKKAKFDNLPTSFLAQLKQGVEDAL